MEVVCGRCVCLSMADLKTRAFCCRGGVCQVVCMFVNGRPENGGPLLWRWCVVGVCVR